MKYLLIVLCLLFITGCAASQPVHQIRVNTETDDAVLDLLRNDFDQLLLAEKIKFITNKYYSTCQQIQNFCIENPYLPNCKKSCNKFYPAWNVSSNATLTSTVNPFVFTQTFTKETFAEYDDETKREIINEGYFITCEQILNYCLNVESVEGCHKYCSKYLLEPSFSGDLFNNNSSVLIQ